QDKLPTGLVWCLTCIVLGAAMTFVAVRGYGFVARMGHISAPWMRNPIQRRGGGGVGRPGGDRALGLQGLGNQCLHASAPYLARLRPPLHTLHQMAEPPCRG